MLSSNTRPLPDMTSRSCMIHAVTREPAAAQIRQMPQNAHHLIRHCFVRATRGLSLALWTASPIPARSCVVRLAAYERKTSETFVRQIANCPILRRRYGVFRPDEGSVGC